MRILLDECVSRRLRPHFTGHDIVTVAEMGWRGKTNGELLRAMLDCGIDVLLTVDRNIAHQQNILASGIALLVLVGSGTRLADLIPLVPSALAALTTIQTGEVVEITA